MENYDSSVNTKKHILLVGKYIDVLHDNLVKVTDYSDNIENATLLDLLLCIANGQDLPFDEKVFKTISDNSRNDYSVLSNIPTERDKSIYLLRSELQNRKILHDKTKLEEPEKGGFDIWTPKLAGSTYGSDEYKNFLVQLKKVLSHHYANNRHHPEHFQNGIYGMNIIDISEMLCDWTAACQRHNDGNIYKSIDINQNRFEYGPKLSKVFKNTVDKYFK